MLLKPDFSVENLQQSLALYRRLVSLIRIPKSESEVIRIVVDAIQEQFPAYRAALSRLDPNGTAEILYSKEQVGAASLSGRSFSLAKVPNILQQLLNGTPIAVPDIRAIPSLSTVAEELLAFGGNVARVDVPFRESEENLFVFSLAHSSPVNWQESTIGLLREVGELVCLMLREARTQEKLQRSETLFRQFAENVQVVFWMTDSTKMEMVYVSPSYEKIWGRTAASLYQNPLSFLEAIHPEDQQRVKDAIMRQANETYEQQYRVVRPDGTIRWVKDRGFQVRDEEGKVHRIAGIAEDITQLHQAQESLIASQQQVISTAKFAALGEMASGMAHEINNPLAVIHGLSVQMRERFLKESIASADVLDNLQTIEKMSNRIAAIVKGLRTFSRQTVDDPMVPADLVVIVQDTLAMCEAKLRAENIDLKILLPDSQLMIRCRSSEISQVILNLISNAFDAVQICEMPTITLTARHENGLVKLMVEDNGSGISPELHDRIFQPFFTTKEVGKGTGLGLSISKGIVEAHGGRLSLESRAGLTRFLMELPSGTTSGHTSGHK